MRLSIRTKKKLSPITSLPVINLRPRPLRGVKEVGEEAFQPLRSIPP